MQIADRKLKYRLGLTWPEYQKRIEEGKYQFHSFSEGFAITEILDFVEERVCIVHLVGGENSDRWKLEAESKLIAFAKRHNCKAIEAMCRQGLEKLLAPMGWKRTPRVEMRKEI
jgi:hypothetical protein